MKYFTPTIVEILHYGQEYETLKEEFNNDASWYASKINDNPSQHLAELIRRNRIRIKYLDNSDLKELGFSIAKDISLFWTRIDCILYQNNSQVCIQINEKTVFNGTLKSKSQLERILKLIT